MGTVAICLWLNGRADEAATFYCNAFASALGSDAGRRLGTHPLAEDRVPAIAIELAGQQFRLLEGSPAIGHNGTAVIVLDSLDQREALAAALGAGGESLPNGWMIDRFGTAWLVSAPHTTARHAVVASPLGPLTLVVDQELLTGIWYEQHRGRPAAEDLGEHVEVADDSVLAATAAQLGEYFAGTRTVFDLPLGLSGGTFDTEVWRATQSIPLGATATYGEIAVRLHDPRAAQAAGGAIGRNPISVVVPCHRVVAADGDLTGYAGGLLRKQWMLDHEAFVAGHVLFDAPAEGYLAYSDPVIAVEVRTGLGGGTATANDNRLPEDVPLLPDPSDLGATDVGATEDVGAGEAAAPTPLRLPRHGAFATVAELVLDSFPAGTPVRLDATLQLRGAGAAEIVVRHQPRDGHGRPTGDGTEHILRLTAPTKGAAELVLDRTGASVAGSAVDDAAAAPVSAPVPVRRAGAAAVADLALLITGGRIDLVVDGEHSLSQQAAPADAGLEVLLRARGAPARLEPVD